MHTTITCLQWAAEIVLATRQLLYLSKIKFWCPNIRIHKFCLDNEIEVLIYLVLNMNGGAMVDKFSEPVLSVLQNHQN
jgi:hypothetical protein